MFQRGGNIRYGVGVLYLLYGDISVGEHSGFVELEKLSSGNWYFYVEH